MASARFVSRYGNYSFGIQSYVANHFGTGEAQVIKPRIDAQFHTFLTNEDDYALALSSFSFPGLPEDFDTNTNVAPRFRVSVWDSEWARENEGFSDTEIDLMIEKLRAGSGVNHVEVTAKPAELPFPSYDELSVEEILQIVKLTSIDPESVAKYELEHQNREDLINRLLGKAKSDDAIVVQA